MFTYIHTLMLVVLWYFSQLAKTQQKHTYNNNNSHLTAHCPGLPRWAGTRKVKPMWILRKQETVSGSGISWAICKSAHRSRQITMPAPHHSVFYRPDTLPAAQPTASMHWRQKHTYKQSANLSLEFRLNLWLCAESVSEWRVAGCFVLFFALSYPLRNVSRLTLLKGGRDLNVTTYSHFGRTRHFTVPLDDVSCTRSRTASPAFTAMKIRNHWMYYLLDGRDGTYHEPELFDYVIGLNRALK